MCRMTEESIRYRSSIVRPGRYHVVLYKGLERYIRAEPGYVATHLHKPLYAIRVKHKLPPGHWNGESF